MACVNTVSTGGEMKVAEEKQKLDIVPNADEVFNKVVLKKFMYYVDEHDNLAEVEKQSKEARGYSDHGKRVIGIDDKIKDMLADLKKVLLPDGRSVQVVERAGNEYLDQEMLLEAGVSADVIARCKRRGAASWFIRVDRPKS